jgi:hypothetical protein
MSRNLALTLILLGLSICTAAVAAERKAYKYVDEKGNVIYSQTPPADGREAKKVDVSPAQGGRGGYSTGTRYDDPRRYSSGDDRREEMSAEQQRKREEAEQKRLAELEAECVRNRGTDCKNPETLRLIESQRIPRGRYSR